MADVYTGSFFPILIKAYRSVPDKISPCAAYHPALYHFAFPLQNCVLKDIFGKGLAKYTFTEQCEEIRDLHLEDGTKKIFLNMTSKKGEPVLVSLLQYMKHTTLENSEILVKDERIAQLDEIVTEIKQSEEWEAVRMSILSIGLERGMKKGVAWGIAKSILDILEETGPVSEKTREMILTETDAERLSAWVKKAARSNSEEDFLSKI